MKSAIAIAFVIAASSSAAAIAQTAGSPEATTDAAFAAMDANKDGKVDRAEYGQYIQARSSRQAEAMEQAFVEMDKDKDGKISKAEASAVPVIASAFVALDTNTDGSLSSTEMQEALVKAQAIEAAR